jgi:AmiR/NasT family two-component response regulator
MSENDAYKTLRQTAMKRNLRLIDVARNILDMVDLL